MAAKETFAEHMAGLGYTVRTTFWDDFSIADRFGAAAVRDTFNRAFDEWKTNHIYLTELVIVLNHRVWLWYERSETETDTETRAVCEKYSRLYNDLWRKADGWACRHLKGAELDYFYRTTD